MFVLPFGVINNNNKLAATRKEVKYAGIVGRHMFEPIAVETLGVFNASAIRLLNDLGRRMVTPERLVICISEFRCWCSSCSSMLFCYTAACRSLTAWTEHHTLSVIFINF